MVLGKIYDAAPQKENLVHFVKAVTGSALVCIDILQDFSFEITMHEKSETTALVDTTALYEDTFPILLEAWSAQDSLNFTVLKYRIIWVQLVDLCPDCVKIADRMAAKVGKVCVKPKAEELYRRGASLKYAVKVLAKQVLPKAVEIWVDPQGKEVIYQKCAYPGLKTHCEKCGSPDHLQEECVIKAPWKAALLSPAKGKEAKEEIDQLVSGLDQLQVVSVAETEGFGLAGTNLKTGRDGNESRSLRQTRRQ